MNPETLKLMKESAAKALDANRNAPNWFEYDAAVQNFRAQCSPANVSALIAEYERLRDENERLRGVKVIGEDLDRSFRERAAQEPMTAREIASFTGNTPSCAVANLRLRKGVSVTVAGRGKREGARSHNLYSVRFD